MQISDPAELLQAEPQPIPGRSGVLADRRPFWRNRQSAFHRYAIVVIFSVTCLLLSLLIVEQQQIIDSQRALIRQLFQDSKELNGIKIQNLHPGASPKPSKK